MESSLFSIKYFVKYLIIVGLIYSILKMVPSQQISQKDITLIIAIALIGFISLDSFLCKKSDYETFTTQPTQIIQSQPIVQMGQSQPITQSKVVTQPIQMIQSQPIAQSKVVTQPIAQSIVAQPKQVIQPIAQSNINNSIAIKYFESLINDLSEKGLLDQNEIANIKIKMNSKLLTIEEIIKSLEVLKTTGKSKFNKLKDDSIYNELPPEFYAPLADKKLNEWDNDYTILNTTKWQVPMLRPPVCVNTIPCQICPSDSSNYSVNLKYWDESRYVTSDNKINKKWVANQN